MKYYCYNCSATPCILEAKGAGNTVPFMCPWCKVEQFATWIAEDDKEKVKQSIDTKE